ncbi:MULTISPECIES: site-specific integrase [Pseudomonas]|uniref:Site-specific integrase n=1 Tax=Pseudomonas taiwanensis TaxID=470150 RepID=A0ABR6VAI9_9PSED|nr:MULTISPECIES: site-specific integrase [Pseudomonas]MBC3477529.1 site-specific integrase [Pseudomonas taiwanensis]
MKTREEIFELVKAGRQRIKEVRSRKLSKSTNEEYVREYNRLVGDEGSAPEKLWSAICNTSSKSTYRRRVAAVMHCCRSQLREALGNQDAAQRAGDMSSLIDNVSAIEGIIEIMNIVERHKGKCPLEVTVRRKSKRSDLRKLPNDWREQLHKQFALSKYELAYLVEAVSGCRPGELEKGVKVICTEEGRLTIRIDNGVKVTEEKGQPWREISYRVDQSAHALVKALFEICRKPESDAGETETVVRIEKSTNWRAALSSAGQKLWPRLAFRICPYHLRNAAASDVKRSGLNDAEVSAALGHCVDKTASIYGQFQIGWGGDGLNPEAVRAARPVLNTRTPLPEGILDSPRTGSRLAAGKT